MVTAYALAFGSLLLFGGRLGDLIGRKVTFLAGALGFAAASAVGGAAASFDMLVAARACQGAFGALLALAHQIDQYAGSARGCRTEAYRSGNGFLTPRRGGSLLVNR